MGDLDRIDDELFALDYRAQPPVTRAGALVEPPTIRLQPRTWVQTGAPHGPRDAEEQAETAIVIGLATLLVLVLAAAGLVLWWWT